MATPYWTFDQVYAQLNSGHQWTGGVITYAFPSSPSGAYSQGEEALFRMASADQQALMAQALQTWDDLIAPNFRQTTATGSNIEFAYTRSNIGYAHAYYPTTGSIWFNGAEPTLTAPDISSYGFLTLIHEIGHALGLNHMGDYNGEGAFTPSSFQDSTVLSVMSYFGPYGSSSQRSNEVAQADWQASDGEYYSPQTPMLNDVSVIQRIYGASTTTRTDDTIYGFASNITGTSANVYDFSLNRHPILTIFDSAGHDTLNLSGFASASNLSLVDGVYSSCNDMSNNLAIAANCVIENAITGSGHDRITGNAVANRIDAGAGDDVINGGEGDDVLIGGAGNDTIDGGGGSDIAILTGALANYTFDYDAVRNLYTIAGAATDINIFSNVEYFQFSDVLRPANELFEHEDNTAPTLLSRTPADNATAVAAGANLVLTFSEAVQAGSGDLVIHNANGSVAQIIAITDTTQVSVSGHTVTINPAADLAAGATYYVQMASGVLKDLAGNAFTGLTGSTAWNFSTAVSALNDDYSNSTNTTGVVTLNGAATEGNINFQDDADLFKVYLTAGTSYTFTLTRTAGGLTDPYLQLYSTDVELITYDDDSAGDGNASITHTASTTGLYYLAVWDYDTGTGTYRLSAATSQDDYPWSTATTGEVVVNGANSSGHINTVGDADLFKVDLTAGTTYTFALSRSGSAGLADPYLLLYGPDLTKLSFDDESGGNGNAQITFSASTSGTYYLGAMDYDTGTGTYQLSAMTAQDDYPWSTATTGEVVVNGSAISGTIGTADDADLFKVALTAGTTYTFALSRSGSTGLNDPYLLLYGPDLTKLGFDDESGGNGNAQITFTASTSGTYYLGVTDYATGNGSYTLRATTGGQGVLQGTALADVLIDEGGSSQIYGLGGNDWIEGGAGNDLIDGGDGIDWAWYAGTRSEYSLAGSANRWTLADYLELDGIDTLVSVERLNFADINLALDMDVSQSGGKTALIVGAALGVEWLDNRPLLGALLDYFDTGRSLADAASVLVDAGIMRDFAGGASNGALAQLLYRNVMGNPTDTTTVSQWTGLMDSGAYTQAEFLATVASLPANQSHVNLVGLAANGLEFIA
ncbi:MULTISPECIES: Ig-like domain-containing protein [Giesbergeria]|uniref:Ig-like domain-containing protein n=1 Tax=Giesbergeria sinuosa TaxID=80883 RepID=A0ABV9QD21_9BURK